MKRLGMALIVTALVGCAEPPDRAVEVRALFAETEVVLEERWAPHELGMARNALAAAERELRHQDGRFAWMRNHAKSSVLLEQAEQDLIRARSSAARARRIAEIRSNEALEQVISALRDSRSILLITQASSGRHSGQRGSGLEEAADLIDDARELMAAGLFDEAERLLDSIHDSIASTLAGPPGREPGVN